MDNTFTPRRIAIGEGIYSRPQSRVNSAYEVWKVDNPGGTASDFLTKTCTNIRKEGMYITRYRCTDNTGDYIVKVTDI